MQDNGTRRNSKSRDRQEKQGEGEDEIMKVDKGAKQREAVKNEWEKHDEWRRMMKEFRLEMQGVEY